MERIFKRTLSKIWPKLQQSAIEIFAQVKGIAALLNLENESVESKKAFYFLSLMLLISLIFLSPDKILQTFTPTHAETGILEKAQEVTKLIRKIMPFFHE